MKTEAGGRLFPYLLVCTGYQSLPCQHLGWEHGNSRCTDFLWICWFGGEPGYCSGFHRAHLPGISFIESQTNLPSVLLTPPMLCADVIWFQPSMLDGVISFLILIAELIALIQRMEMTGETSMQICEWLLDQMSSFKSVTETKELPALLIKSWLCTIIVAELITWITPLQQTHGSERWTAGHCYGWQRVGSRCRRWRG